MAKKVVGEIKLQIPGGQATPSPPVGPALGQRGVNIMEFCKAFNARTQAQQGLIIPVIITVYADRSFSFVTKTPPVPVLIKKTLGVEKGSGEPAKKIIGFFNPCASKRNCDDKAARPQCEGYGCCYTNRRRNCPQHGRIEVVD